MKKFTIITPTYKGRENVLARAIECVDAQIHWNWEHIIVADGPLSRPINTDNQKRRLITLPRSTNDSGNTPRAVGLQGADSDYVIFFDDDNLMFPQYLSTVLDHMRYHDYPASIICGIVHMGPLPAKLGDPPQVLKGNPPILQNVDTLQFTTRTDLMKTHGWLNKGYLADGYTIESFTQQYGYAVIPDVLGVHL